MQGETWIPTFVGMTETPRAGIQYMQGETWIPTFVGMTETPRIGSFVIHSKV